MRAAQKLGVPLARSASLAHSEVLSSSPASAALGNCQVRVRHRHITGLTSLMYAGDTPK